jgi:hypothetical protein
MSSNLGPSKMGNSNRLPSIGAAVASNAITLPRLRLHHHPYVVAPCTSVVTPPPMPSGFSRGDLRAQAQRPQGLGTTTGHAWTQGSDESHTSSSLLPLSPCVWWWPIFWSTWKVFHIWGVIHARAKNWAAFGASGENGIGRQQWYFKTYFQVCLRLEPA